MPLSIFVTNFGASHRGRRLRVDRLHVKHVLCVLYIIYKFVPAQGYGNIV